jgi:hypothetical protein
MNVLHDHLLMVNGKLLKIPGSYLSDVAAAVRFCATAGKKEGMLMYFF